MQALIKSLLIIAIIAGISYGETDMWTEQTDNNIDHEGDCYSTRLGAGAMSKGEVLELKDRCMTVMCEDDGTMTFKGCKSIVNSDPLCEVEEGDLSRPFPRCCPLLACA